MNRKRFMVEGLFVAVISLATWFFGWVAWDDFQLWTRFSVATYEKILMGIMCLFALPFLVYEGIKHRDVSPHDDLGIEAPDPLAGIPALRESEIGPFERIPEWEVMDVLREASGVE